MSANGLLWQGTFSTASYNIIAMLAQLPPPLGVYGMQPPRTRAQLLQKVEHINLPDHRGQIHFNETLTHLCAFSAGVMVKVPECEVVHKVHRAQQQVPVLGRLEAASHNTYTNYVISLLQARFRGYEARERARTSAQGTLSVLFQGSGTARGVLGGGSSGALGGGSRSSQAVASTNPFTLAASKSRGLLSKMASATTLPPSASEVPSAAPIVTALVANTMRSPIATVRATAVYMRSTSGTITCVASGRGTASCGASAATAATATCTSLPMVSRSGVATERKIHD